VRVVGAVGKVAHADASHYWESRPRGHRLSAWA
jgi:pyridoxine/pyridoxamine 5'-phosphate oxidase